jgi:hypothetical protein
MTYSLVTTVTPILYKLYSLDSFSLQRNQRVYELVYPCVCVIAILAIVLYIVRGRHVYRSLVTPCPPD